MRRLRPVTIGAHPSFYEKMESIRKMYQQSGINMSQMQLTDLMAKRIRVPCAPNLNVLGGNHAKKKGRPY